MYAIWISNCISDRYQTVIWCALVFPSQNYYNTRSYTVHYTHNRHTTSIKKPVEKWAWVWIRYESPVSTLWIVLWARYELFCEHIMNCFASTLWIVCEHVMSRLWARYESFVSTLWIVCEHVMNCLRARYYLFVSTLWFVCEHVINQLWERYVYANDISSCVKGACYRDKK